MLATVAHIRVIICLLFLIGAAPLVSPAAGAQESAVFPVLRSALTMPPSLGLVAVSGDGFTPGGLVSIVLYDRWGQDVFAPVRTVASVGEYGANGSADPARGYVAPGSIDTLIDITADEVFGPNGSVDPAQGYEAGPSTLADGLACGQLLMVRAHDARTDTWTNLVDIVAAC